MKLHVKIQSPMAINRIATERTLMLGSPITMTGVVKFKGLFIPSFKWAMSTMKLAEVLVALSLG